MKKYFCYFIIASICFLGLACSLNLENNNKSETEENEAAATPNPTVGTTSTTPTSNSKVSTPARPSVSKKKNSIYNFALISRPTAEDSNTSVPTADLFLTSPKFPAAILLMNDFPIYPIEEKDWSNGNIPDKAILAFKNWFAGGGSVFYLEEVGSEIRLYRRYIDEVPPEEANQYEPPSFELMKSIGLNNKSKSPGYFICYTSDQNQSLELSIHFSAEGRATALKYKGQQDYIPLKYLSEKMETDGAHPNIYQYYQEIYEGKENGNLELIHSGIWDYANYTRKKDSKQFHFAIDHEQTVVDDTYRTTPCYE